jgi:hypothetical protein
MDHQQLSKKQTVFLVVASLIYVAYHLLTLSYSPLPWFDEVSFASISESYMKHGTFFEDARRLDWHGEKLLYGPIYFVWQGLIGRAVGLGMFTFRITPLVFGFLNLALVYKICRRLRFSTLATTLTILILALDPSYNQFMNSGRMDMITLFEFLAAYLLFTTGNNKRYLLYAGCAGVLLACGMLTNPRIIFAFPFFVCVFFYDLYMQRGAKRVWGKYLVTLGAFVIVFGLWIVLKFGGLHNFVQLNYTNSKAVQEHVGFSPKDIKLNLSMLLFAYSAFGALLLFATCKAAKNAQLLLLTVPVILGFLVVVSGGITGRYYASAAPFTVLLFVGATINEFHAQIYKVIAWGIASLFAIVFVGKAIIVLSSLDQRDEKYYEKAITEVVPQHASVIGDFQYYYVIQRNNDIFECLEVNGAFAEMEAYFQKADFDYVIINESSPFRKYYEQNLMKGRYDLVATINRPQRTGTVQRLVKALPYMVHDTYNGYIYKLRTSTAHK